MFSFDDTADRSKLEARLSVAHDKALKAGDLDSVLRYNAVIEKIWLKDDQNVFYMDPGCKPPFLINYN
jgi:hypothetical protein